MNNIRLQKYKKNRMAGMSKYNAAIAAGYSETTATARGKDLDARAKIGDVLERAGLTDRVLAGKVLELIEASDFIFKRDQSGRSEIIGDIKLYEPNWSARAKGLDLALRLKDLLKDKVEHSGKIDTPAINLFVQNIISKAGLNGQSAVNQGNRVSQN